MWHLYAILIANCVKFVLYLVTNNDGHRSLQKFRQRNINCKSSLGGCFGCSDIWSSGPPNLHGLPPIPPLGHSTRLLFHVPPDIESTQIEYCIYSVLIRLLHNLRPSQRQWPSILYGRGGFDGPVGGS